MKLFAYFLFNLPQWSLTFRFILKKKNSTNQPTNTLENKHHQVAEKNVFYSKDSEMILMPPFYCIFESLFFIPSI